MDAQIINHWYIFLCSFVVGTAGQHAITNSTPQPLFSSALQLELASLNERFLIMIDKFRVQKSHELGCGKRLEGIRKVLRSNMHNKNANIINLDQILFQKRTMEELLQPHSQLSLTRFFRIHLINLMFQLFILFAAIYFLFYASSSFLTMIAPLNVLVMALIRVAINSRLLYMSTSINTEKFKNKYDPQLYEYFNSYYYQNGHTEGQLVAYKMLLFVVIYLSMAETLSIWTQQKEYSKMLILVTALLISFVLEFEIQSSSKDYWIGPKTIADRLPSYRRNTEMRGSVIYKILIGYLIFIAALIVTLIAISHHDLEGKSVMLSCCSTVVILPCIIARMTINLLLLNADPSNCSLRQIRFRFIQQHQDSTLKTLLIRLTPTVYRLLIFILLLLSFIFSHQVENCQLAYFYAILLVGIVFEPLENFLLSLQLDIHRTRMGRGEEECAICLQELQGESVMELICSHTFHERCGQSALRALNKCPVCRMSFQLQ